MPACLTGPDADSQALHLTAYLATLGEAGKKEEPPTKDAAAAGGKLFAHLGCVSCHTLPTREDWATVPDRIPLRNAPPSAAGGARVFLRQPDKHYQWIPHAQLRAVGGGCRKPAVYVLSAAPTIVPKPGPAGDPKLARNSSSPPAASTATRRRPRNGAGRRRRRRSITGRRDAWKSCQNRSRGGGAEIPTDRRRGAAWAAFAATDRSSLHREALPEFAERQIPGLLGRLACHKRDERQEDPWTDLSEETEQLVTDGPPDENPDESLYFPPEQICRA